MTQRLHGKTAFVTAAGQGIGRASAEAFIREGARVIATDINAELLAELAKAWPSCETQRLDVTDANAVTAAARAAGGVDILFNGAGYVHAGTILDCDDQAFDFSFDLNVRAMYRMTRAFLRSNRPVPRSTGCRHAPRSNTTCVTPLGDAVAATVSNFCSTPSRSSQRRSPRPSTIGATATCR